MEQIGEKLAGKRVYFDTNIIIYLVEGYDAAQPVLNEIQELLATAACQAVTSEFTLCEVLIAPFRQHSAEGVDLFRSFLEDSGVFELAETTRAVHIRAAIAVAHSGMKPLDAIHIATAQEKDCTVFLTNDRGIRVPDGMERIIVSDFFELSEKRVEYPLSIPVALPCNRSPIVVSGRRYSQGRTHERD